MQVLKKYWEGEAMASFRIKVLVNLIRKKSVIVLPAVIEKIQKYLSTKKREILLQSPISLFLPPPII